MTDIAGCYFVAKLQGRYANQQVGERETNALGGIFTVDLTCPESDRNRHRMNRLCDHELIQKLQSRGLSFLCVGACRAVREFDQRNDRDCDIFSSCANGDTSESLASILALALCRYQHAGV